MSSEAGVVFGLFILMWVVWLAGFVLWIWAIVDVSRTPDHAFRIVGREKVNWILVVALVGIIGALVWCFGSARSDVKRAAEANPFAPPRAGPPPGWYPEPTGGPGLAWWDGARWTGHRQQQGPPPPNPDFQPPFPPGPPVA